MRTLYPTFYHFDSYGRGLVTGGGGGGEISSPEICVMLFCVGCGLTDRRRACYVSSHVLTVGCGPWRGVHAASCPNLEGNFVVIYVVLVISIALLTLTRVL
jgi:hypothetical protein